MGVSLICHQNTPRGGGGPVHSQEVPLPLIRDEIGLTAVVIAMVTAQIH